MAGVSARGAIVDEFCDFGHGRNLEKPAAASKVNRQAVPARFNTISKSNSGLRHFTAHNQFARVEFLRNAFVPTGAREDVRKNDEAKPHRDWRIPSRGELLRPFNWPVVHESFILRKETSLPCSCNKI